MTLPLLTFWVWTRRIALLPSPCTLCMHHRASQTTPEYAECNFSFPMELIELIHDHPVFVGPASAWHVQLASFPLSDIIMCSVRRYGAHWLCLDANTSTCVILARNWLHSCTVQQNTTHRPPIKQRAFFEECQNDCSQRTTVLGSQNTAPSIASTPIASQLLHRKQNRYADRQDQPTARHRPRLSHLSTS